jgi:tripeptidyl-peptidase-1
MRCFHILFVPLLTLLTHLIPLTAGLTPRYVQHEVVGKRQTRHFWTKRSRVAPRTILPVRIGLTQSNLQNADDYIMEVADPRSPKYGQHWTAKQIADTFAPSQNAIDAVKAWLQDAGISADRISLSRSLGWLTFDATATEVESLLKTEYHHYENEITGRRQLASDTYSVPKAIRDHVDFIIPTLQFAAMEVMPRQETEDSAATEISNSVNLIPVSQAKLGHLVLSNPGDDLSTCDQAITPDCIRALYGIPNKPLSAKGNSLGVVEYSPQSYRQQDLDLFFEQYAPNLVGQSPIVHFIDGDALYPNASVYINTESDLDLQYTMTFVQPLNVSLYQVGDFDEGGDFNNFLDAIDGSYCTYDGGDLKGSDPVFPDPNPAGYQGPENCGGVTPALVITTSYSADEALNPPDYLVRQCHEYMKLGLMGITILFSSGDYGVAGEGGDCRGANGIFDVFQPSFPGTCPYITSVGATQIVPGKTVTDPEVASQTEIYSGGGFSNLFPLPSYQKHTLDRWWIENKPPYSFQQFNNSQNTRGYPDIAANGVNYTIADDDDFYLVSGTSCSSPVLSTVFTHINDELLLAGKKPVGFVNPVLYAHPEILNDIESGDNPGCRKFSLPEITT